MSAGRFEYIMLSLPFSKPLSYISFFNSFAVFLFSAFALVVPSGYSYGPLLLFLTSFCLIFRRRALQLEVHDWWFIAALSTYFCVSVFLSAYHGSSSNSYDRPLRYLLAIPVYLLLVAYPPHRNSLFLGLIIGGIGAGGVALYQQFFLYDELVWPGRSNGFLNPIQFGDISFLIGVLSIVFAIFFSFDNKETYIFILLLISGFMAFLASFLSLSRGGWVVAPVLLFFMYKLLSVNQKRIFKLCFSFALILLTGFVIILSKDNVFKYRLFETSAEIINMVESGDISERTSAGSRLKMWAIGVNAWAQRPCLGWGDLAAIKKQFPLQWVELNKLDNFNHLHNEYVDVLAKSGVVGFAAFLSLLMVPLYHFIKLIKSKAINTFSFPAAGVSLIVCVMIFGVTQCFLLHNSGTMIFVFYLVIIRAYCRSEISTKYQMR